MTLNRRVVVGVFDDPVMADRAVNELQNAGFSLREVLVASKTGEQHKKGFLESLKQFFAGADRSVSVSDLERDLTDMGLSEEAAHYYNEQYSLGKSIVGVRAEERVDDALSILRANGGYNFETRVSGAQQVDDSVISGHTQSPFSQSDYDRTVTDTPLRSRDVNVPSEEPTPVTDVGSSRDRMRMEQEGVPFYQDQYARESMQTERGGFSALQEQGGYEREREPIWRTDQEEAEEDETEAEGGSQMPTEEEARVARERLEREYERRIREQPSRDIEGEEDIQTDL